MERLMPSNVNPEYLRRNLLVAKAIGAHANSSAALKRLRETKRPAQWLVKYLEGIIERTEPLVSALACYRAVVPRTLDSSNSGESNAD
jgi:hypothetical protein